MAKGRYIGTLTNDKLGGTGTLTVADGTYIGSFSEGLKHGYHGNNHPQKFVSYLLKQKVFQATDKMNSNLFDPSDILSLPLTL